MINPKIGQKIKAVLKQRNMKLKDFAMEIGMARQNIYRLFEKESIDTDLLLKICKVLDYNFFDYFSPNSKSLNESNPFIDKNHNSNELYLCKIELEMSLKEIDYLKKIIALMEKRSELLTSK